MAMERPPFIILWGFLISPRPLRPMRQALSMEYMTITGTRKSTLPVFSLIRDEKTIKGRRV